MTNFRIDTAGKPVDVATFGNPNGPHFTAAVPLNAADRHALQLQSDVDMTSMVKIPFELMMRVRWYFMKVRDEWQTESFVFIHQDQTTHEYTMVVPSGYTASSAAVGYFPYYDQFCTHCHIAALPGDLRASADEKELCPMCGAEDSMNKNMFIAGTIHSHVDMAPFHSGTDNQNELTQSGMHFTLGHMKTGLYGSELSVVAAKAGHTDSSGKGVRHSLVDSDIVEMPFGAEAEGRIDFWMDRVAVDRRVLEVLKETTDTYVIKVDGIPCFFGPKDRCEAYAAVTTATTTVSKAAAVTRTVGRSSGNSWSSFGKYGNYQDEERSWVGGYVGSSGPSFKTKDVLTETSKLSITMDTTKKEVTRAMVWKKQGNVTTLGKATVVKLLTDFNSGRPRAAKNTWSAWGFRNEAKYHAGVLGLADLLYTRADEFATQLSDASFPAEFEQLGISWIQLAETLGDLVDSCTKDLDEFEDYTDLPDNTQEIIEASTAKLSDAATELMNDVGSDTLSTLYAVAWLTAALGVHLEDESVSTPAYEAFSETVDSAKALEKVKSDV